MFDGESLDKLADFSHRKQEISDVKFSPSAHVCVYVCTYVVLCLINAFMCVLTL